MDLQSTNGFSIAVFDQDDERMARDLLRAHVRNPHWIVHRANHQPAIDYLKLRSMFS